MTQDTGYSQTPLPRKLGIGPEDTIALIGAENLENRRAIEHYGNVRVVGNIPVLDRIHRAALLEVFEKYFDRSAFEFH